MEYQQTFCIHKLLCYHTEKVMCGLWSLHHIFERKYLEAYLLVGKIIDVSMYHPHDIHVFTIYLKKKKYVEAYLLVGKIIDVSMYHPHDRAATHTQGRPILSAFTPPILALLIYSVRLPFTSIN